MMTAVLIDDESKALKSLEGLLKKYCPEINILGTANSAQQGFDLIQKYQPQLIFLDVAMPNESGFDLLRRLPSLDFEIIFVTGFDNYAIDAFRMSATGYIVKPIETADLIQAVYKAKQRIALKTENQRNRQLLQNISNPKNLDNKIGIPTMEGLQFIKVKNIIRCEALQRVTKIIIQNQKPIVSSHNLGEFIKILKPYDFFSTHRSHLINLNFIKNYNKEGNITMTDDSYVPLSRRRKKDFLEMW
ncbi:MAG: LytR/AlgR family response regulator transcription factor [Saprospiraceae bacterium]